jgi:hypothetical protein
VVVFPLKQNFASSMITLRTAMKVEQMWASVIGILSRQSLFFTFSFPLMGILLRATTGGERDQGKGINGGVWEWTSTLLDSVEGYANSSIYPG